MKVDVAAVEPDRRLHLGREDALLVPRIAALGDVPSEARHVLVVDVVNLVDAKLTDFTARRIAPTAAPTKRGTTTGAAGRWTAWS